MSKQKVALSDARYSAEQLQDALTPFCERVLIAGSVRRNNDMIGDIELVVIPQFVPIIDMFGSETGKQQSRLDDGLAALGITFSKNGDRYKQFVWRGISTDLFIADRSNYGLIATIRTGCMEFSQWLVTEKRQGGAKPGHLRVKDGQVWQNNQTVATPEERDLFTMFDIAWIEPAKRTAEVTQTLWRR